MYQGGTKLISLKLYRLADFYLDNVDGPKSLYINEAVDDLLHDHQTGHLDAKTLEHCLASRAWWIHKWPRRGRGEASRHTKLRIKRQNLEYMQLNMMNVNITINEAICRKAKRQGL